MIRELKFLFNKLPFYLIFYPTSRCNADCPHCYNHKRQKESSQENELTLDEIDKISRKFGHLKVLTISGGEPFLREDLAEIVSIFYKNNALQYVSFHTNAFFVERVINTIRHILGNLRGLEVFICISIDGIGKTHDDFRGIEGGFEKIIETINRLKEMENSYKNLNLISSTAFSRSTQHTFTEPVRFVQDKIRGVKPSLSFIRGDVKDEQEKDIDYTAYRDFCNNFHRHFDNKTVNHFRPLVLLKESIELLVPHIVLNNHRYHRQTVPCQAGRKLLVIYENGDVYPCETFPEMFGNLRESDYDVRKLLFSQRGKQTIKEIQGKNCYCTWENIIPVNLIYSPRYYPAIMRNWFHFLKENR